MSCSGWQWSDVHLDTGRLEITQALTAVGYVTSFSRLKTKTSRRRIALDPTTIEHLMTWRMSRPTRSQRRA